MDMPRHALIERRDDGWHALGDRGEDRLFVSREHAVAWCQASGYVPQLAPAPAVTIAPEADGFGGLGDDLRRF